MSQGEDITGLKSNGVKFRDENGRGYGIRHTDNRPHFVLTDGTDTISIEERKQTPTGNALNVQIGPGDVISNIPVVIDFDHHQVHEGEYFFSQNIQSSLGAGTVKYALTVPVYANTIQAPHLVINCDIYNGNAIVSIYEGATFTGGSDMTSFNRNRNISTPAGMTLKHGVTSTNGTLIKTFYVGAGKGESGATRAETELVLKSNTIYRIDLVGRAIGCEAIMGFLWYEDLGV